MKIRPELLLIFLLSSCIYDPPLKGKEVYIHNQTNGALLVIDSLTGNYFKLYDTAKVNDRVYISRRPGFIAEFGSYLRFVSNNEIDKVTLKKKNKITLYFVDKAYLQNESGTILSNNVYRSFDIIIDTLKKYELNHLFVTGDSIFLDHHYDFYTRQH